MPTISMFYGIIIQMFWDDHAPPHFHALYADPGVSCTAPWRLTKVNPLANYRLEVEFIDGTHGFVEMSQRVKSDKAGVFAALKDVSLFNQVHLEYGVATWPGEIDLAPDAMHDEIKLHGKWVLM